MRHLSLRNGVEISILHAGLRADFLLRIAANDNNGRWAAHHRDLFADSPHGPCFADQRLRVPASLFRRRECT